MLLGFLLLLGNVFEEHCVIAAFEAEGPSQISAESGDQVLVINKDNSGGVEILKLIESVF